MTAAVCTEVQAVPPQLILFPTKDGSELQYAAAAY